MPNTLSRFLQRLQPQPTGLPRWIEVAAVDGAAPRAGQYLDIVDVQPSGRLVREIRSGIRLVLKQFVKLLYLSPLLIALKLILSQSNDFYGDLVTVGFVMIVVVFFVVLNLYLLWSVVCHAAARRGVKVVPPFARPHGDLRSLAAETYSRAGSNREATVEPEEIVVLEGTVHPLDDTLPRGGQLVRDLWALEGSDPWRLTEAVDFVLETDDGEVVVCRLESAPFLIGRPTRLNVVKALGRLSKESTEVFQMGPELAERHKRNLGGWLQIERGDRVELAGAQTSYITNVEQFELDGRMCGFDRASKGGQAPYRGSTANPGTLVTSSTDNPLFLKKVS